MSISNADNYFSYFDKVKFFLALLLFFLGLISFFGFQKNLWLLEQFVFLFSLAYLLYCLFFNKISRSFFSFCKESFFEVKRVSWPDRKSAVRMTGTVCVFAVLISVFICLIDKIIDFFFMVFY
ncbi:preprotein translocase subunit SecE [Candidatus Kinetoplastidibacterium galati]|uniref:Preprotein translocase, SecE subunit n=1 Tax=Candidatus Kinetoplastidibacterium galati TCC219 TaxID=1208921 RepID=M1MCB8_9PROT|nr:preprotein translocase subunit SecE [Candidatus Kinetoplastibacterium galatii]AGF49445.1 preprotein translocase, SecE subunit [Candidatus Kinetoplastibacterium galatii TCC219]